MDSSVLLGFALIIGFFVIGGIKFYSENRSHGPNQHITCPHCHHMGTVTVTDVTRKKGVSGGKATGAVLTGGASLLATGLSRKEGAKHLRCGRCGMEWDA